MDMELKYDRKKLLFRRQFVLGPHFLDEFTWWKRVNIASHLCLTVHPDLNTYQCIRENKSITLLGYILDPTNPEANDYEIIHRLIAKLFTPENDNTFCEHISIFGGRWILIVNDGREIRLFNDAMGLRQVFYTNMLLTKDLWCASQPGIIADILRLEMDRDAVNEYMNVDCYKKWSEYLWPGDSSPYSEIKHLLPNHYLDLKVGLSHRYWPDKDLEKMSLDHATEEISKLLKGLMRSAANRFELALGMTAGWDTRLILAACKEISHEIYYFTILRKDIHPWNEADTIIAPKLLSKLGLIDHIIMYPDKMEEEFEKIYKKNVTTAHEFWGTMNQGLYDHYPRNRVCITGNAGEISRVRFRLPEGGKITAKDLARFSLMPRQLAEEMAGNPFVIKAWERWLSGVGHIYNIHTLDLYYWEHWAGNFAAMGQAERDIVQEAFTPYNCRRLLTNMLSVDEKCRDHDYPILYKELIMKLWPEVLKEPVNPVYQKKSMKSAFKSVLGKSKRFLVKTHLYQFMPEKIQKLAKNL